MTVNCIVLSDVTERMSLDFFYVSKLCHTNDRSVVYHSNFFSSPLHYFLDLNEPKMRCFHTFCAQQKKKWQISCKKFNFFVYLLSFLLFGMSAAFPMMIYEINSFTIFVFLSFFFWICARHQQYEFVSVMITQNGPNNGHGRSFCLLTFMFDGSLEGWSLN